MKMSLAEFKKFCESADNMVKAWDQARFKIVCMKCKSENTFLLNDISISVSEGSSMTGFWTDKDGAIVVKCFDCGQAMTVLKGEDV